MFNLIDGQACAELQGFVQGYSIIEYDIPEGEVFKFSPTPRTNSGFVIPFEGKPNIVLDLEGKTFEIKQAKLMGGLSRTYQWSIFGKCRWMVIKLHPATAAAWFHFSADAITNYGFLVDDMSNYFQNECFYEQLSLAPNDSERFKIIDKLLLLYLKKQKIESNPIIQLTNHLYQHPQKQSAEDLAAQLRISKRSLERKFLAQVGFTPKQYLRINRFNWLMRYLFTHPEATWFDLVVLGDFYDQSHLIKDFYEFTGHSPEVLLAIENPLEALILKKM
jgi:AraC-like DNA-binding protein